MTAGTGRRDPVVGNATTGSGAPPAAATGPRATGTGARGPAVDPARTDGRRPAGGPGAQPSTGGGVRGESRTPALALEGISKRFGSVVAVDDVSLEIAEGEFFSLLGPSGCGKTTTLRMMAGFEEPDQGRVRLRGEDVTFVPPNRRNVNLVFQHYELFPHMTVFENVAYGLRLRKVREPGADRAGPPDAPRGPGGRAGEARSAPAVGRTAAAHRARPGPREPPGRAAPRRAALGLDVKLRKQMQLELKAIQADLGTTFVYVTHDQEEALLLSDRIGIMNGGRLLQVGSPREIYERPADAFVADFVGSLNVLTLELAEQRGGVVIARPSATEQVTAVIAALRRAGSAQGRGSRSRCGRSGSRSPRPATHGRLPSPATRPGWRERSKVSCMSGR